MMPIDRLMMVSYTLYVVTNSHNLFAICKGNGTRPHILRVNDRNIVPLEASCARPIIVTKNAIYNRFRTTPIITDRIRL